MKLFSQGTYGWEVRGKKDGCRKLRERARKKWEPDMPWLHSTVIRCCGALDTSGIAWRIATFRKAGGKPLLIVKPR